MARRSASNKEISALLDRIADLLQAKGENPFRIRSYRTAAQTVKGAQESVAKLVKSQGTDGLTGMDGVGEKLAELIQEYVEKGEVELLQTLEKEVPEIKIHEGQKQRPQHSFKNPIELPVSLILDIDQEYREKAAAGKLKQIAPRQYNPKRIAWLPILTTTHKGYKFTVLFSNTQRAHELGKTNDWVVVYYEKGEGENQCTVVTEQKGSLKSKRVIRGREKECAEYYKE
jgi:putative hydrolase